MWNNLREYEIPSSKKAKAVGAHNQSRNIRKWQKRRQRGKRCFCLRAFICIPCEVGPAAMRSKVKQITVNEDNTRLAVFCSTSITPLPSILHPVFAASSSLSVLGLWSHVYMFKSLPMPFVTIIGYASFKNGCLVEDDDGNFVTDVGALFQAIRARAWYKGP